MQWHPRTRSQTPGHAAGTRLICLLCGWRAGGPLAIQRFQPTRTDRRWCAARTWNGWDLKYPTDFSGPKPSIRLAPSSWGRLKLGMHKAHFRCSCGILRPGDGQRQLERVWRNDLAVLNSVSLVVARSELGRVEQGGRGWRPESVQWKMNCSAQSC